MADMRKQSVDKGKAKHEEVKELYELLPARDGRYIPHSPTIPLIETLKRVYLYVV